jgi:dTDP-4-amino-4,6-dideoxygalactose transaminase
MKDRFIPVTRSALPAFEEYHNLLLQVWSSGQMTNNGPLVKHLSIQLAKMLGIKKLHLVANGTLALQLAIKAFELQGDIITTPYSYVATTSAILWENCAPIFVDVDSKSFCLNPDLIETSLTNKTTAILATHVYGYPCDIDRIQKIANKYKLKVIYDAAHSFNVRLHGQSLLNYGDCSILSFHATKLFHTVEGGAIICRDADIARRAFLMSKFGHLGEDDYLELGINAKMSEFHAAMGLALLPSVPEIIASRRQCSAWYDEFLEDSGLQRPQVVDGLEYNYAYYPVVFKSHERMMAVRTALQEKGVFPRRYFYPSLNTLPFLPQELRRSCPVSESLAQRVLSLPLYVNLSQKDVEFISNIINYALSFYG